MKQLDIILKILAYKGQPTNDPSNADSVSNRIQDSDITSVIRYQLEIADSTVDQVVPLPDPNSDYLAILTDQDISIKVNGWSTAQVLKTRAKGKDTLVYFTRGPLTGLTISNSSGSIANCDIFLANK